MVEFSGVSKTYNKNFDALKNINLTINDGEFVFVVGASGAGKSTFLKLIMREEVPTAGNVTINGYDLNKMKKRDIPYFRRTLGIVFQDFRLIPDMKVYDNVAFALRVTGTKEREVRKRVSHAMGMVGLLSKTQSLPKELSGGEQQRVAIARALVNDADIIIADEPTGNIDPAMSIEIMDLLTHINKSGTTVIMVTHAHELVKQYDHRIVVLREGSIVSDGYDKEKALKMISPEVANVDVGFYNAPNQYDDVEKFIISYGTDDVPLEETIPAVPKDDAQTASNSENTVAESSKSVSDEINADDKDDNVNATDVSNNDEINAILKAFAESNAAKIEQITEERKKAAQSASNFDFLSENSSEKPDDKNDQPSDSSKNGGDGNE